mgnify:FL=1
MLHEKKRVNPLLARHDVRLVGRHPRNIIFVPLSDSANLCVDDTKESGKAFWTLVNFNSSPAVTSLSIRVNGLLRAV